VQRRLFGCQVNAVDSQGLTALHRVAKQGNVQACRLLIQYGADLNIASLQGYTAAQLAPESLQKILKGTSVNCPLVSNISFHYHRHCIRIIFMLKNRAVHCKSYHLL